MKKSLSVLLSLFMLISMFSIAANAKVISADDASTELLGANSGKCGSGLTWNLDAEGTFTISGEGSMYNYEYADRIPWQSIKNNIKTVIIEDGVTRITDYAFFRCPSLESLTIGNTVTTIGGRVFEDCKKLKNVVIPDSVVSLGYQAFAWCSGLESITIPASVTTINNSFYNCNALTIIGVKGSMAETYANNVGLPFVEIEGSNEPTLPEADSNEYMNSENMTMPNVVANTTASKMISKLSEYGINATVTDKDGNALADENMIGTGCKVSDGNGNVYTVIVNGDIDGTGEVNATDYLQIKKMFLGALNLENEYFTAADTDADGEITATDYLQIKKYFLGTLDLYA